MFSRFRDLAPLRVAHNVFDQLFHSIGDGVDIIHLGPIEKARLGRALALREFARGIFDCAQLRSFVSVNQKRVPGLRPIPVSTGDAPRYAPCDALDALSASYQNIDVKACALMFLSRCNCFGLRQ